MLIFTGSKIGNARLLEVQQRTIPITDMQAHQDEETMTPLRNTAIVGIQGRSMTVMTATTTATTMTEAAIEIGTEKNADRLTAVLVVPAAAVAAIAIAREAEAHAPPIDPHILVVHRVEKSCSMDSR